jgi:hypothetical protein
MRMKAFRREQEKKPTVILEHDGDHQEEPQKAKGTNNDELCTCK